MLSGGSDFTVGLGVQPVLEVGHAGEHGGLGGDATGSDVWRNSHQIPLAVGVNAADEGATGVTVAGSHHTSGVHDADLEGGVVGSGVALFASRIIQDGDLGFLQGHGDGARTARAAPTGHEAGVRQTVNAGVKAGNGVDGGTRSDGNGAGGGNQLHKQTSISLHTSVTEQSTEIIT